MTTATLERSKKTWAARNGSKRGANDDAAVQHFRLGDIRPNPFRDLTNYPVLPEVVEHLRASMQRTGFWENLIARMNEKGEPELAFGHHRLEALRQEKGENALVPLIIRVLDDEAMFQMMIDENMERPERAASNEQECVEGLVRAFAEGRITPPEVDPKTKRSVLRFAPSFRKGGDDPEAPRDHPYTASTLAAYLGVGWGVDKVASTLAALELFELGLVERRHYRGLSTWHAAVVTKALWSIVSLREEQARDLERQRTPEAREYARERREGTADDANYAAHQLIILLAQGRLSAREVPRKVQSLCKPPSWEYETVDDAEEESPQKEGKEPGRAKAVERFLQKETLWVEQALESALNARRLFKPAEREAALTMLKRIAEKIQRLIAYFEKAVA